VNVELLTFQQRLEIAKEVFVKKKFIYQFFPAYDFEDGSPDIGKDIDEKNKKQTDK